MRVRQRGRSGGGAGGRGGAGAAPASAGCTPGAVRPRGTAEAGPPAGVVGRCPAPVGWAAPGPAARAAARPVAVPGAECSTRTVRGPPGVPVRGCAVASAPLTGPGPGPRPRRPSRRGPPHRTRRGAAGSRRAAGAGAGGGGVSTGSGGGHGDGPRAARGSAGRVRRPGAVTLSDGQPEQSGGTELCDCRVSRSFWSSVHRSLPQGSCDVRMWSGQVRLGKCADHRGLPWGRSSDLGGLWTTGPRPPAPGRSFLRGCGGGRSSSDRL